MRTIFRILIVVGLLMLIGAGFLAYDTKSFQATAIETNGRVVELVRKDGDNSTTYAPVVAYVTKDNQTFTIVSSVSSNPPSYSVGDQVAVYYQPDNPQNGRINSFISNWLGSIVLASLGAILFLIGIIVEIWLVKRAANSQKLKQTGIRIQATFDRVELNKRWKVNNSHPYRLVCQWLNPQDNKLYMFYSDNLWFNPESYVDRKLIDVYVKPGNFKVYTMDTSFLPKKA